MKTRELTEHSRPSRIARAGAALAAAALALAACAGQAAGDPPQRQLTVFENGYGAGTVTSSPAGIQCGSTCVASFEHGAVVTLTGSPAPGSEAVKWSGCTALGAEGKCMVTMSAARAVTATFLIRPKLTLSIAGAGSGTVTSAPAGISCGAICSASFAAGASVTLTATPGPHTKPASWSGCTALGAEGKCVVAMSANRTLSASFEAQPGFPFYAVAVAKAGSGSGTVSSTAPGISCGADCSGEYLLDSTLVLTAVPDPGSTFTRFSGGGCAGPAPSCTTTVKAAKTITAVFALVGTRALSVTKSGSGQGTVSSKAAAISCGAKCSAQVKAGKKVTITATPAPGSTFAGFTGACTGTKACKLTMSEARQVNARFDAPPAPPEEGIGGRRGAAVLTAAAKVKAGRALLRILCNGPQSCRGRVALYLGKARLGASAFAMAPGTSRILGVALSGRAKAILAREGHLRVRAKGSGVHAHNVSLKPVRRGKR